MKTQSLMPPLPSLPSAERIKTCLDHSYRFESLMLAGMGALWGSNKSGGRENLWEFVP